MSELDKERAKTPVRKRILAWIGIVVTMVILGVSLLLFITHYPSDSLSNYPNTCWTCEALELELYVDETGIITGVYKNGSEMILLEATARASTKACPNYIRCYDQVSRDEMIYILCYYANIDDGVFYGQVDSRIPTMEAKIGSDLVCFKFIKQG